MPIVQEHMQRSAAMVGRVEATSHAEMMAYLLGEGFEEVLDASPTLQFSSVFEAIFWTWWKAVQAANESYLPLRLLPHVRVDVGNVVFNMNFVIDLAQAEHVAWTPIGIELDAHGIHDIALTDVSYSARGGHVVRSEDWKVFRFSWVEFTGNPDNAIWEVAFFARQRYHRALAERDSRSPAVPPQNTIAMYLEYLRVERRFTDEQVLDVACLLDELRTFAGSGEIHGCRCKGMVPGTNQIETLDADAIGFFLGYYNHSEFRAIAGRTFKDYYRFLVLGGHIAKSPA